MQDQVTVILTTPDATLFKEYQQFHAMFALMVKTGVFDVKNGSITIHFGSNGEISSIKRNDSLYDLRAKT